MFRVDVTRQARGLCTGQRFTSLLNDGIRSGEEFGFRYNAILFEIGG